MSIAPDGLLPAGPKGAPFSRDPAEGEEPLRVRDVERVRLQPGDRLIIHCDGSMGLGPGGAYEIASQVHTRLRLDELGFDVPAIVAAPGMRFEVLHP